MKKVLIVLFASITFVVCQAQKNYSIHDWQGQVFLKEYRKLSWFPIEKKLAVSGLDSVNIAENGMLRVLDKRNNQIYKSIHPCKSRIIALINEAKKHNSHMIASVNRELWENAKMPIINDGDLLMEGAATRGDNGNTMIPDKIADTFGWIASQVLQDKLENNDSNMILKSHTNADSTFYFELQNNTDRGFFVNVLYLNKSTKKVSLCYIINEELVPEAPFLYLPEKKTLLMDNILFSSENDNDVFILVGTEDPYIPEQMQNVLQYMDIETAMPIYDKYVYYIQ